MRFEKTVVIAAHPDDEVLGAGGVIAALTRAGRDVTVLIVTDGSSTQYAGDPAMKERKDGELRRAHEILGTRSLVHWDYPDMRLDTVEHRVLNQALSEFIAEHGFDTVLVHGPHDVNLDHRLLYHSVLVATRPVPEQSVSTVLTYFVNSSTEWGSRSELSAFVPNLYIDISATIETKLEAMAAYGCELREHPHPRSLESLRDRAAVFGSEAGYRYAEAFRVVLGRGGIDRFI